MFVLREYILTFDLRPLGTCGTMRDCSYGQGMGASGISHVAGGLQTALNGFI